METPFQPVRFFDLRHLDMLPSEEVVPIVRAAKEQPVDIHLRADVEALEFEAALRAAVDAEAGEERPLGPPAAPDTPVTRKLQRLFGGFGAARFYGRGYQFLPARVQPDCIERLDLECVYTYRLDLTPETLAQCSRP